MILLQDFYLHLRLLPSQSDVEHIQKFLQILTETESSDQIKLHMDQCLSRASQLVQQGWTMSQPGFLPAGPLLTTGIVREVDYLDQLTLLPWLKPRVSSC